jgi:alkyl hydroperoxide reductase subunit AhpC
VLSEKRFEKYADNGVKMLHISMSSAVQISAWGNRTKKIRKEVFIPFRLGNDFFEKVCIIAPDMLADL